MALWCPQVIAGIGEFSDTLVQTVAIYAEEDKLGLHRFKADEAYRIGEGMGPVAAYLSITEIIRVAKMCGADAIHPGYGLLSENPDFVDACEESGIKFIGPKAETMRKLGDKASARRVAMEAGVPVVPATDVLPDDMNEVRQMAEKVGYPFMLKASWGESVTDITTSEGISESRLWKRIRLAFLSPKLVKAILDGTTGQELTIKKLSTKEIPLTWAEQHARFLN